VNIFTHQIEGGGDDSSKLHEIWGQKEGNIGRAEGRKELLLDLDNGASYDSIAIVVNEMKSYQLFCANSV
jgi:hypothetical protein